MSFKNFPNLPISQFDTRQIVWRKTLPWKLCNRAKVLAKQRIKYSQSSLMIKHDSSEQNIPQPSHQCLGPLFVFESWSQ